MKCILRFCAFLGIFLTSYLADAQLSPNFNLNPRSGCRNSTTHVFQTSTQNLTSGAVGSVSSNTYKYVVYWDSAGVMKPYDSSSIASGGVFSLRDTGFYSVQLNVKDSLGNDSTVTKNNFVYVSNGVAANFSTTNIATDTAFGCPGKSVTFVNTSDTVVYGISKFTWNFIYPDGTLVADTVRGVTATLTKRFTTPGNYDIILTEQYGNCLSSITKTAFIKIDSLPHPSFTVSNANPCSAPVNIFFSNTSSPSGNYKWYFGDGSTSTLSDPAHTFTHLGAIRDTLIAYSILGGCPDTLITDSNIVIGGSVYGFSMLLGSTTIANGGSVCQNAVVTFKDDTTASHAANWHWNFGDGKIVDTSIGQITHVFTTSGLFTIVDSAYNSTCYGYTTHTLFVNPLPQGTISIDTPYKCSPPLTVTFTATINSAFSSGDTIKLFYGDAGSNSDTSISYVYANPGDTFNRTHTYLSYTGTGSVFKDTLIIIDSNGCKNTITNNPMVHLGQAPTFNIGINGGLDSGCIPFVVNYTTSAVDYSGNPIYTYNVDSVRFGHDSLLVNPGVAGADTIWTPDVSGYDTITVYYSLPAYLGGCSYIATAQVHVNGIHADYAGFYPTMDTPGVCPRSNIHLASNCTNCSGFKWNITPSVGTINSLDTIIKIATPNVSGYHVVAIANHFGCTDTAWIDSVQNDTIKVYNPAAPTNHKVIQYCDSTGSFVDSFWVASVTGGGMTRGTTWYRWSFGDGSLSNWDTSHVTGSGQTIPNHHYLLADSSYKIYVYDSLSDLHHCVNWDTFTVRHYKFVDTFSITKDSICKGGSITLKGPSTQYFQKYAKYTWHWGDGTFNSSTSQDNFSHIYNTPGQYRDTLIIQTSLGCTDTLYAANLQVNFPMHNAPPDSIIHVGGFTGTFTVSSRVGCAPFTDTVHDAHFDTFALKSRNWSINHGAYFTSSSTDTSFTFAEGSYLITLIDTDIMRCVSYDTINVKSQKPHAYFTSPQAPYLLCLGKAAYFSDTNTTGTHTFQWSFGDFATGSGQNVSHSYGANNTYTVTEIITDGLGCMDTMIKPDYVNVASMNVGFSLSDTFENCPGDKFIVAHDLTTVPTGDQFTFMWRITPYGEIAEVTNQVRNYYPVISTPGTTSTITLIDSNRNGCMDSVSHSITVAGPAGYLHISNNIGCAPLLRDTITFIDTNNTRGSLTSITFITGDGNIYDGSNSDTMIVHDYLTPGNYHPSVIIDGGGCGFIQLPDSSVQHYTDSVKVRLLNLAVGHPHEICFGSSTRDSVTILDAYTDSTYTWTPSTGLSSTSTKTVVANPTDSMTIYTVTVVTTNGCVNTITDTIKVDTIVRISITGIDSLCAGVADTFFAHGLSGSGSAYTWSGLTGLLCTTCNSVWFASNTSDTFTIHLHGTDTLGCAADTSYHFYFKPIPVLTASTSAIAYCNDSLVHYVPNSSVMPSHITWSRTAILGISPATGAGSDSVLEQLTNSTNASIYVTYTFSDSANGCGTDTNHVTVKISPTAHLLSIPAVRICSGDSITIPLQSTTDTTLALSWTRSALTGINGSTGSGALDTIKERLYNSTTDSLSSYYAVVLNDSLGTNRSGCRSYDTVHFTVKAMPVLTNVVRSLAPYCSGDSLKYSDSISITGATGHWSWNGSTSDTGSGNVKHLVSNSGNTNQGGYFTYTVSASGCTSANDTIKYYVRPIPKLNSTTKNFTICSNTTFFDSLRSLTPGTKYSWVRNYVSGITPDSLRGNADSIKEALSLATGVYTSTATKYYISLNDSGCLNFDTLGVTVLPQAHKPTIASLPLTTVCSNTMYQNFGATSTPPTGEIYAWSAAHASIAGVGNTNQYCLVNFDQSSTSAVVYLAASIAGSSCPARKDSFVVAVTSGISDNVQVVYLNHNFICARNDEASYQWGYDNVSNLDSNLIPSAIDFNYYQPAPDFVNKYYWVMTKNANGCMQKSYFNAPLLGVTEITGGIETNLKLYPNPANEYINVEINVQIGSEYRIEVLNLLGQSLNTSVTSSGNTRVDVSSLPAGSYIVVCYRDGVKSANALFIKN